ncbi:unnamed protein product, partial [Callosobruchus maculatus]
TLGSNRALSTSVAIASIITTRRTASAVSVGTAVPNAYGSERLADEVTTSRHGRLLGAEDDAVFVRSNTDRLLQSAVVSLVMCVE